MGAVGVLWASAALALFLWYRSTQTGLALLRILPPQADLYGLADLEAFQRNPAVRRFLSDPPEFSIAEDYQRFVEASGFRYQDNLRQVALAKLGSNWVGAARLSVDRPRILRYLETEGTEKAEEEGQTVFVFGQSRPFRLALPETDWAVFTIGEDATLIGQALRRLSGGSADSGAPEIELDLERDLARDEDWRRGSQGSALWLIGRMDRLLSQGQLQPEAGPFRLAGPLLRGSKTLYVTVESRLTQLEFQVETRCEDAATAERIARTLQSLLVLLRAVPADDSNPMQGKLSALFRDISIQQVADSVLLQWQWDAETLRNLQ